MTTDKQSYELGCKLMQFSWRHETHDTEIMTLIRRNRNYCKSMCMETQAITIAPEEAISEFRPTPPTIEGMISIAFRIRTFNNALALFWRPLALNPIIFRCVWVRVSDNVISNLEASTSSHIIWVSKTCRLSNRNSRKSLHLYSNKLLC